MPDTYKSIPALKIRTFYLLSTLTGTFPAYTIEFEQESVFFIGPLLNQVQYGAVTKVQFAMAYIMELIPEQVAYSFPEFYKAVMDDAENTERSEVLTDEQSGSGNG